MQLNSPGSVLFPNFVPVSVTLDMVLRSNSGSVLECIVQTCISEVKKERLTFCGSDYCLTVIINRECAAHSLAAILDFDFLDGDVRLSRVEHYLENSAEAGKVHTFGSRPGKSLLAVHRDGLAGSISFWQDNTDNDAAIAINANEVFFISVTLP